MEKSRWQDLESTGHIASLGGGESSECSVCFLLFVQSRAIAHERMPLTINCGDLPTSVTLDTSQA